jgi:hypothetical protein
VAKQAIEATAYCLTEITDLSTCSITTLASVTTTPGDLDRLEFDGIVMSSTPIHHKSPSSGFNPSSKDVPLNKHLHDQTKLANLGLDHNNEALCLPTLTMDGK